MLKIMKSYMPGSYMAGALKLTVLFFGLLCWASAADKVETQWDIGRFYATNNTLDTSDKTRDTRCMVLFDNDSRLLVHARSSNNVVCYQLDVPGDLSSARFVAEFDTSPYFGTRARDNKVGHGIYLKPGTFDKLWLWNRTELWEFTLEVPGDIRSAVQSGYHDFSATVRRGHGIDFQPEGHYFYVDDRNSARVWQFRMEQPWNIDSMELVGELDLSPRHRAVRGVRFKPDGSKVFLLDTGLRELQQYRLADAWQIESAELETTLELPIRNPRGITWNSTGDSVYIVDASTGEVTRFDTMPTMKLPLVETFFVEDFTPDSKVPNGFWSARPARGITSQELGPIDGRFHQMIETARSNTMQLFYSRNEPMFSFADRILVLKLDGIQHILPETLDESYNWYHAWGFADEGKRMEKGAENSISCSHRFHYRADNNTVTLYAGKQPIGKIQLPVTGHPVDGNRSGLVLPTAIELRVGPETAELVLFLPNGEQKSVSGKHGFDPSQAEWMASPVINMTAFVGSAQGAGREMGFTLDTLSVAAPDKTE